MRPRHRRSAIVLAILLGVCLIALAITLNVGWIVLNWREILPLAVGIPVTLLLIAGRGPQYVVSDPRAASQRAAGLLPECRDP